MFIENPTSILIPTHQALDVPNQATTNTGARERSFKRSTGKGHQFLPIVKGLLSKGDNWTTITNDDSTSFCYPGFDDAQVLYSQDWQKHICKDPEFLEMIHNYL